MRASQRDPPFERFVFPELLSFVFSGSRFGGHHHSRLRGEPARSSALSQAAPGAPKGEGGLFFWHGPGSRKS